MTRRTGIRQFQVVRYYMLVGKILFISAAVANGALAAFFVVLYHDKH